MERNLSVITGGKKSTTGLCIALLSVSIMILCYAVVGMQWTIFDLEVAVDDMRRRIARIPSGPQDFAFKVTATPIIRQAQMDERTEHL